MRVIQNFNQNWCFIPEAVDDDFPDDRFEAITLPHSNKRFVQRFVDNQSYQFVSTYRKRFTFSEDITSKRVFIDFDGAMLKSTVYLNGHLLGIHQGGFTPFSYEMTEHINPEDNLLTVYVDATEDKQIPPYGNLVDYLTFGGLYRDVKLRIVNPCHIVDVFVRTKDVLTSPWLECDIWIDQPHDSLSVVCILEDMAGNVLARQTQQVHAETCTAAVSDIPSINLWTLENPALYNLRVILSEESSPIDEQVVRFGFRSAEFHDDGHFYLNGEPLNLFGLNRHQTYPYIGAAAPARLQQMDAEILK